MGRSMTLRTIGAIIAALLVAACSDNVNVGLRSEVDPNRNIRPGPYGAMNLTPDQAAWLDRNQAGPANR